MVNTDKPRNPQGGAPNQPKTKQDRDKTPAEAEADDRPRWEDELLGDLLQKPSSEGGGSREEKGVVPDKKKPG
jgi:hypothetical protein